MNEFEFIKKINDFTQEYIDQQVKEAFAENSDKWDVYVSDDEEGNCSFRFFDGEDVYNRKFYLKEVLLTKAVEFIEGENLDIYIAQMEEILSELIKHRSN